MMTQTQQEVEEAEVAKRVSIVGLASRVAAAAALSRPEEIARVQHFNDEEGDPCNPPCYAPS